MSSLTKCHQRVHPQSDMGFDKLVSKNGIINCAKYLPYDDFAGPLGRPMLKILCRPGGRSEVRSMAAEGAINCHCIMPLMPESNCPFLN